MSEWRAIPEFSNYEASDDGQVRRLLQSRGTRTGKVLRQSVGRNGYLYVWLRRDGRTHGATVHRLVCRAFHGDPPTATHHAGHHDGDRANNRADNLAWITPKENSADQARHGTLLREPANPHARLTDAQVQEIRCRAATETRTALALEFGVSQGHVSDIVNGRVRR